jgi:hypothetical protein
MGLFKNVEYGLDSLLHHQQIVADKLVKAVEAKAEAEKQQIIAEARSGIAQLKAAVVADEPAIAAAAQKALDDALHVIEAIAATHGL